MNKNLRRRTLRRPKDLVDRLFEFKLRTDRESFARERKIRRTLRGAERARALKREQNLRGWAYGDLDTALHARRLVCSVSHFTPPYDTDQALTFMFYDYYRFIRMIKKFSPEDAARVRRTHAKIADDLLRMHKEREKFLDKRGERPGLRRIKNKPSFLDFVHSRASRRAAPGRTNELALESFPDPNLPKLKRRFPRGFK